MYKICCAANDEANIKTNGTDEKKYTVVSYHI
jgi:hypothetical protein